MRRTHHLEEGRRQPALLFVRRLSWLVVPVALVAELGHAIAGRIVPSFTEHVFHLAFGLGAGLLFAIFVAVDIRRHGRPTFSFRSVPRR